jgi:signal transduction histidine kinase
MKSVLKLIRRFVGILLLSSFLLLIANLVLLAAYTLNQMPNVYPWQTAAETAAALSQKGGEYLLSGEQALALEASDVWGLLIHNETGQAVWHTDNLPSTVPRSYSASDIAELTRGYIDDYPTFTARAETGLVVLGYPKDSFWKHMWPSWDYGSIVNLPKTILSVLVINVTLIFLIYVGVNSRLLKSVKPILNGIQSLPAKETVHLREKGLLSELAACINETSKILQSQNRQLRRRETARANWIAGVSHDIRTPLSMVMGYADSLQNMLMNADICPAEEYRTSVGCRHVGQKTAYSRSNAAIVRNGCTYECDRSLAENERGLAEDLHCPAENERGPAEDLHCPAKDAHSLTEDARRKASVIVKQSERIRDLINNLNLASKLEYNMQPLHPSRQNLVSLVRQIVVDFINIDVEEKHPIQWLTPKSLTACFAEVDQNLIRRAVSNLIQNCINHNGHGCHIFVEVLSEGKECIITVEDDGVGASPEEMEKLNNAPHYMVCDENTAEQRHGLGLLLVRQIMAAHGGQMQISPGSRGGFRVRLVVSLCG